MTRTVVCALVGVTLLIGTMAASAASADFERVLPGDYTTMLRDAKKTYERKHFDEAFHPFQHTACAGDTESQSAIGRMYLLGQRMARNDFTGYAWLKVADATRMRSYQSIVEKLEQAMTPAQRAVADPQAATLVSQDGLRATNTSCTPASSRGGLIKDDVVCTPLSEGMQVLLRRRVAENPVAAKLRLSRWATGPA